MYQLIRAVGKPIHNDGRWADLDISNMVLSELFRDYSKVFAIVQDEFMSSPGSLDLATLRDKWLTSKLTFGEFLVQNGNKTLTVSDHLPVIKTRYVRYEDGFRAGYQIKPIAPGAAPDADYPNADKTNLYLTHPKVDFNVFNKRALVSINGYFHYTDGDGAGATVKDGMRTCRQSRENGIGIYSFYNVSSLNCYPIKPEMIKPTVADNPYRYGVVIDTGLDLANKAVFMSLGGYLIAFEPQVLKRINDQMLFLSLQNVPIVERYHESRKTIDYSLLPFERNAGSESLVNVDDFLSDENLLAYLTMSQSFLIVLDNPDVYVDQERFHVLPGKGRGVAYTKPILPLRVGAGRMAEYWKVFEDGQWSITMPSSERDTRAYNVTGRDYMGNVNEARLTQIPVRRAAVWLKIATDLNS